MSYLDTTKLQNVTVEITGKSSDDKKKSKLVQYKLFKLFTVMSNAIVVSQPRRGVHRTRFAPTWLIKNNRRPFADFEAYSVIKLRFT